MSDDLTCWGCGVADPENSCEHCCGEICDECSYVQPRSFVLCKDCHDQEQEEAQAALRNTPKEPTQ